MNRNAHIRWMFSKAKIKMTDGTISSLNKVKLGRINWKLEVFYGYNDELFELAKTPSGILPWPQSFLRSVELSTLSTIDLLWILNRMLYPNELVKSDKSTKPTIPGMLNKLDIIIDLASSEHKKQDIIDLVELHFENHDCMWNE